MNGSKWSIGALLLFALVSCSDGPAGVAYPKVDRVDVGPAGRVLTAGDTMRLTAYPRTADGTVLGGPVTWRSLDTRVATVTGTGVVGTVRAHAVGTVRIEAEYDGKTGAVEVTVTAAPLEVATVEILPANLALQVDQWVLVEAVAKTADGVVIGGRAVTWSSSNSAVASADSYGNGTYASVRGQAPGQAFVRADVDGVRGTAVVVVTAVPAPVHSITLSPLDTVIGIGQQFTMGAVLRAQDGSVIPGRAVTWTSTSSVIATVDPLGRVRGVAAGSTTIRASVDGAVAQTEVQVRQAEVPVGHVLVRPAQAGIWINQSVSYAENLVILDQAGRPLPARPVSWAVEDSSIAAVDDAGMVRGLRQGTTRIRATSGGVNGHATVVVFAVPGDSATYDLTYDWWDGVWRLAPMVDSTTWTDSTGAVRQIALHLTGGTLTFGQGSTYERVLVLEGWAVVGGVARKVAERHMQDRGTVGIIVGGETGYRLLSSTTPGLEYVVVGAYHAGHLVMRDAIGAAPLAEYMLRLRQ